MSLKQNQIYAEGNRAKQQDIPQVIIFPVLALVIWIANFWHSGSFGLYEDDWVRISTIVGLNWQQLLEKLIENTAYQGRPFHDGSIFLFSFLGLKLGELQQTYGIGFALVCTNSWLFYLLLKKLYHHQVFALTGALTFCLFPADTTRDYLTHSLGIQPSLSFLLIALHLYTSKYRKLSYFIASLCLVAYEPLFTVFFVAPLFNQQWDRKLRQELFRHGLILIGVIVFAAILRKIVGENQISHFGVQSIVLFLVNPIIGAVTSLVMLVYRPIETLFRLNGELWIFCLLLLPCFGLLLNYLPINSFGREFSWSEVKKSKLISKIPNFLAPYTKPIITGLSALVLAYPLTMTSYGFAISGRSTRVHFAAIIGVSILSACLCSAILNFANNPNRKRLAIVGIAVFFTLLLGFGIRVQQDYQLMWQHQRGFWTDLVRLCPDLQADTVIFVEPTGLRDMRQPIPFQESRGVSDPKQIKGIEWELPYVLERIYQFPSTWQSPPKVYRLQSDWQDKILAKQNLLHVSAAIMWLSDDEIKREVDSSNVILLETKNGELTRRIAPLTIANRTIKFKVLSQSKSPQFKKTDLYNLLIKNPTEQSVDYLIK